MMVYDRERAIRGRAERTRNEIEERLTRINRHIRWLREYAGTDVRVHINDDGDIDVLFDEPVAQR